MVEFLKKTVVLLLVLLPAAGMSNPAGDSGARVAVQKFFSLLKAEKYPALYDYLPTELQKKTSRDDMTNSLKRLRSFIEIDKMEIGRVQQKGDFAVVDTTITGKLSTRSRSGEAGKMREGKIIVQQYLFKEGRHWRVATSDSAARTYFLKRYPEFKQGFQLSPPHFFVKEDGQWRGIN